MSDMEDKRLVYQETQRQTQRQSYEKPWGFKLPHFCSSLCPPTPEEGCCMKRLAPYVLSGLNSLAETYVVQHVQRKKQYDTEKIMDKDCAAGSVKNI